MQVSVMQVSSLAGTGSSPRYPTKGVAVDNGWMNKTKY